MELTTTQTEAVRNLRRALTALQASGLEVAGSNNTLVLVPAGLLKTFEETRHVGDYFTAYDNMLYAGHGYSVEHDAVLDCIREEQS